MSPTSYQAAPPRVSSHNLDAPQHNVNSRTATARRFPPPYSSPFSPLYSSPFPPPYSCPFPPLYSCPFPPLYSCPFHRPTRPSPLVRHPRLEPRRVDDRVQVHRPPHQDHPQRTSQHELDDRRNHPPLHQLTQPGD